MWPSGYGSRFTFYRETIVGSSPTIRTNFMNKCSRIYLYIIDRGDRPEESRWLITTALNCAMKGATPFSATRFIDY